MSPVVRIIISLAISLMSALASAASAGSVDVSWPDLDGTSHALSDYRGKWVVVNYWATTCPPCLKEMPELSDFHLRHKDRDAVVLGINHEDIPKRWLQEFLRTVPVSYPVLLGGADEITPFGPITVLPTTFIVSPTGRFMGRQTGTITAAALDAYLERQAHAGKGTTDPHPEAAQ